MREGSKRKCDLPYDEVASGSDNDVCGGGALSFQYVFIINTIRRQIHRSASCNKLAPSPKDYDSSFTRRPDNKTTLYLVNRICKAHFLEPALRPTSSGNKKHVVPTQDHEGGVD